MTSLSEEWRTDPRGQRAVDFFNGLTLIGDYTGQRWTLEPWQEEPIRRLYGDRNQDGTRQIKTVFFLLPRKVGKTQLAAGIGLIQLVCGNAGQEIYAASSDRDKASRLYKAMAQMIRANRQLSRICECSDHYLRIKVPSKSSVFQALAADQDQGHSLSPSTLILDELHLWRRRDLYDALSSGFGARKDRLEILISTAGTRKQGLCWDLYQYAKNVASGIVSDPEYLPVLFEANESDDWTSPEIWARAMPSLGTFTDLKFIESECRKAQKMPWKEGAFKQLYLNIWNEVTEETWIAPADWRACYEEYTEEDLYGAECTAALDLSSVRDLTSLSLFFPATGRTLSYSWLPSEGLKEREERDNVKYMQWRSEGWLNTCTGGRIVHQEVADDVNDILQKFDVTQLVADPYSLHLIAPHLNQEPLVFKQGCAWMSPPSKWFETAVAEKRIHHNGNPLLAWAVGNTVVTTDAFENYFPTKAKSRNRIDPAIALIMAVGASIGAEEPETDVNTFYSDKSNYLL